MGLLSLFKHKPKPELYSGGSGESEESAIVINATATGVGIPAEYFYVMQVCGEKDVDWTLESQVLTEDEVRQYDVLTVKLKDGTTREFWFDITAFFGKH